jgi:hypothetical protein
MQVFEYESKSAILGTFVNDFNKIATFCCTAKRRFRVAGFTSTRKGLQDVLRAYAPTRFAKRKWNSFRVRARIRVGARYAPERALREAPGLGYRCSHG